MHIIFLILNFILLPIYSMQEDTVYWHKVPIEIQKFIISKSDDYKNLCKKIYDLGSSAREHNLKKSFHDCNNDSQTKYEININLNSIRFYIRCRLDSDLNRTVSTYFGNQPNQIVRLIDESPFPTSIFVSFENGDISKVEPHCGVILITITKRVHKAPIVDIEATQDNIISAGEDGLLYLLDQNLTEKKCYNFKENIKSKPIYIKILESEGHDSDLILVESELRDYVYFDLNLEFVTKIDHKAISKLQIPDNKFLYNSPELILELIKFQDGCSFATYKLIRAIDLAISKNRSLFLHEKDKKYFDEFPVILRVLTDKQYIGKESKTFKYFSNLYRTLKNLPYPTLHSWRNLW